MSKDEIDIHNREICRKAIDTYGQAIQLVVAMEECSELIQAISKYIRGEDHNIEEEVADVSIMLEQLSVIFNKDLIEEMKRQKLKRLKDMLL
ncbi:MAG: hypothetical protein ACRC7N_22320 [Clostridium sp.]